MTKYYLVAYPETVIAIVNNGKLPDKLPSYIKNKYLICRKNLRDIEQDIICTLHQAFIIELDISSECFQSQSQSQFHYQEPDTNPDAFQIAKFIDTNWIKKIIVYSQRANKLVQRLFNGSISIAVEINPDAFIFQIAQQLDPKNDLKKENELKSKNESKSSNEFYINEFINRESKNKSEFNHKKENKEIERVSTIEQHAALLRKAIQEAKHKILITSFSINNCTLQSIGLYNLIPEAVKRGVKIYIYFNDMNEVDESILDTFDKMGVYCDECFTHSKLLVVDQKYICIGSFNWLSAIDERFGFNDDASLLYVGNACAQIKEDFWNYLRYYRNEQFENIRSVENFESNPQHQRVISYDIGNKSTLQYLPTLEQHQLFLRGCFAAAKKRVVICSPFISSAREFEKDIDIPVLQEALKRGVEIIFVCLANAANLGDFSNFLLRAGVRSAIHLVTIEKFHLKTVIVDSDLIAEGSFNWLSATRNRESDFHNHEVTLVLKGAMGCVLVENFYESRVGKAILNQTNKTKVEREVTMSLSSASQSSHEMQPQPPRYQPLRPQPLSSSRDMEISSSSHFKTDDSKKRKLGGSGSEDFLTQREIDLGISARMPNAKKARNR